MVQPVFSRPDEMFNEYENVTWVRSETSRKRLKMCMGDHKRKKIKLAIRRFLFMIFVVKSLLDAPYEEMPDAIRVDIE